MRVILCGIEAPICVARTALCAAPDYEVDVVADGIALRSPENRRIAMERMFQQASRSRRPRGSSMSF